MPWTRKASAVLKTLPTLCMLRMLSSTMTTGIFNACRNSFTDLRPSSSIDNLRIDKGKSPLIHLYPAFPILFVRPGAIFYIDPKYYAHEKTPPAIARPRRLSAPGHYRSGTTREDRHVRHPKDPAGRSAGLPRHGYRLSPHRCKPRPLGTLRQGLGASTFLHCPQQPLL